MRLGMMPGRIDLFDVVQDVAVRHEKIEIAVEIEVSQLVPESDHAKRRLLESAGCGSVTEGNPR